MNEDGAEAKSSFISTLCFVKRGVAKERFERIELAPAEMARIIKPRNGDQNSSNNESEDENSENQNDPMETDPDDEFQFGQYDNEDSSQVAAIGNIAAIDENIQLSDNEEEDSEEEDEIIKPTDNLLLLGVVTENFPVMEVWVFNEEEESLYPHHEFSLPSYPLCIEWLSHDPGSDKAGNLCAIGSMDPIITIWDLDILESLEPAFKLGSKGSRRKNIRRYGHRDAVLDLSWNTHFPHILASASVDKSVILWDLDEGQPHTTIKAFGDKVQSIKFHPVEAQSLLTGCADGNVRLFDGRNLETVNTDFKEWKLGDEIEKVVWNCNDNNYFIVGTNKGKLHYVDIRNSNPVWSVDAHSDEISDICFNSNVENLLTTSSADGYLKIWNFNDKNIKEVYKHYFDMGRLQCMKQSPEDPFSLAFGGEKLPLMKVFNIKNFEAVRNTFNLNNENEME